MATQGRAAKSASGASMSKYDVEVEVEDSKKLRRDLMHLNPVIKQDKKSMQGS